MDQLGEKNPSLSNCFQLQTKVLFVSSNSTVAPLKTKPGDRLFRELNFKRMIALVHTHSLVLSLMNSSNWVFIVSKHCVPCRTKETHEYNIRKSASF